jgi:lipopolysaccharide/colanic/teichoic acid biosynthesis glycosyltransferase
MTHASTTRLREAAQPAVLETPWLEGFPEGPRVGLVERSAALALLLVSTPLLAAMMAAVLLADGRPVLYRGERLGLRKRPFTMYKIRTLRRDAAQQTADRLLRSSDGLEIPGGRFLRDSRLDELPQLWNIVRGDMRFVGPRPERALVYRNLCRSIPGYARRFEVPPGVLGPSQIFTPHSAPKRIRAWLDGSWAQRRQSAGDLVGLSVCTVAAMARKALERARAIVADDLLGWRLRRRAGSRRKLRRTRLNAALAHLAPFGRSFPQTTTDVLDINEQALLVRGATGWKPGERARLSLQVALDPHGRMVRTAECAARVVAARGDTLLLDYEPRGPRSEYVLHQYFLAEALAPPSPRRHRPRPARPSPSSREPRRPWSPPPPLPRAGAQRADHSFPRDRVLPLGASSGALSPWSSAPFPSSSAPSSTSARETRR